MTRDEALALDAADPLAHFRGQFVMPKGLVYLDGNSLGALPKATRTHLMDVVNREWGHDLIASWNTNGWMDAPVRVGDKLAPLIGAQPGEVAVADSTSVNLFRLAAGALSLRPDRTTILSAPGEFPTDLYMLQGLAAFTGGRAKLKLVPPDELVAAVDADTAVVVLTHVHYRTSRRWDMAAVTAAAQAKGALMLWDLSHTAGAVVADLTAANADLAVGCGYKHLSGGPGAPAYLYVSRRHQTTLRSPLTGWMGHAEPFSFVDGYTPAPDIRAQVSGTPPILGMAALESAVDLWLTADRAAAEAKGLALGDLFIAEVERHCGDALSLISPRAGRDRGLHVSFTHPDGYAIVQALIARGVVGDFRGPDVLRFGFAPLYLRYADVWDGATAIGEVMSTRSWDRPEFRAMSAVT